MKIIPPPQMANLDELLDVVLHPDKLAARLKQLVEMRDAIAANLDVYATKEKADHYLSQSQDKLRDAGIVLENAQQKAAKLDRECASRITQLEKDQEAWTKAKEMEQRDLTERKRVQDEYSKSNVAYDNQLRVRALALDSKESELARLSDTLNVEYEKMKKRKELLSAIG